GPPLERSIKSRGTSNRSYPRCALTHDRLYYDGRHLLTGRLPAQAARDVWSHMFRRDCGRAETARPVASESPADATYLPPGLGQTPHHLASASATRRSQRPTLSV